MSFFTLLALAGPLGHRRCLRLRPSSSLSHASRFDLRCKSFLLLRLLFHPDRSDTKLLVQEFVCRRLATNPFVLIAVKI